RPAPGETGIPWDLARARPSEGRRDLVKYPPDGVHVDFLEFGVDAVGEEDIDAPAARVDPEGRPGETGVPDRPLRQCAARRGSGTGGDQKAERAGLAEAPREVHRHEPSLPRVQEALPDVEELPCHLEDRPRRAEEPGVRADTAQGARVEVVHLAPGHLRAPPIVAIPLRSGENPLS